MSQPRINNGTPFAFEQLYLQDEEGQQVFVPVIMATHEFSTDNSISAATLQAPVDLAGMYWGDPASSSYKIEPQIAFVKAATDIALIGHANSPNPVQSLNVGIQIGSLQKVVRVFGDRYWIKNGGHVFASKTRTFQEMPLVYERAFGGWDKSDKDEENWTFEPRNPVGVGFGDPLRFVEEGKMLMPNIEDPQHLIRRYGDTPPPAGFGFVSPDWQPRARYAGTYDDEWDRTRKPLLPKDFDRRFFNAASPGLIAPGYLRGDEDVMVVNASPVPRLKFKLPGIPPPVCMVEVRDGRTEALQTNLDTVIINTDEMLLFLLWRNYMVVPNGPHDIVSIEVTTEGDAQVAAMA